MENWAQSGETSVTRRVAFQAADEGPNLEGFLHLPAGGSGPFRAAVVCHPHTMMGGTMDNAVIARVCQALAAAGRASLRFNFRGAGGSEGHFEDGVGEQDDVKGAVDFLHAQPEIDPDGLAAIGYSFGARVALLHAARDRRLQRMVAIALVAHHYADPFLDDDARPKLFVVGEHDPLAPASALRRYVGRLQPPKTLEVIPGADHLFSRQVSRVAAVVANWLAA